MSKTFKDQPYRVKQSKWDASNAKPWHTHHSHNPKYEDVLDSEGNPVTITEIKYAQYTNYFEYSIACKRSEIEPVPENRLPFKHLDTPYDSHGAEVWVQRVRLDWDDCFTVNRVIKRTKVTRILRKKVPVQTFECTINEKVSKENNWGETFSCIWYQRTPATVVFAADRVARKHRSARFNRHLSKNETRNLVKVYAAGLTSEEETEVDATNHVVLKANDWLG